MFGQTHTRGISHVLSFKSQLQFDEFPEWARVRALPLEEQRKAFKDPEQRRRLIEATRSGAYRSGGGEPRKPSYDNMYVVKSAVSGNPTVAQMAAQRNVDPVEVMMDLALESDFNQLFMQFDANTVPKSEEEALATLKHPRTVMTFSDSGAHVSLIMDSSIHTHLLAYWMRERGAFTVEEAVKMITLTPAIAWGFVDRGLVRQGCIADLNVFDPGDDRAADADGRARSADRGVPVEAEVGRHHGHDHRRQSRVPGRRAHRLAAREAAAFDGGGSQVSPRSVSAELETTAPRGAPFFIQAA